MLRVAVLLVAVGEATRHVSKSRKQSAEPCKPGQPVVGITSGEWPTRSWCGGVFITEAWVLTAASCDIEAKVKFFTVFAGEWKDPHWKINTSKIVKHDDMMMLKLPGRGPLECSQAVQLPRGDWADGENCFATGWHVNFGTTIQYQVKMIDNQNCIKIYEDLEDGWFNGKIKDDKICSQGSGTSTHDFTPRFWKVSEGFPLVCEDAGGSPVLHGVKAWRFGETPVGKPIEKYPEVFFRITSKEIGWISEVVDSGMSFEFPAPA